MDKTSRLKFLNLKGKITITARIRKKYNFEKSQYYLKFLRREVSQRGGYSNENRENNSRGGYNNGNRKNNSRGGYNNYNSNGGGSQQGYSGFNRRSARDGNMRDGGSGSQNLKWQAMNNFAQAAKNLSRYVEVYILSECSLHSTLVITNLPVRPVLFVISNNLLYQIMEIKNNTSITIIAIGVYSKI